MGTREGHGLIKTTAILYVLQVVTMILSFLRSSIFAFFFGTSWQADAYNIALKVPTVLFAVIATAIKTVTIPIYSKELYEKGKERADHFYSNLLTISVCIAIVFSIGVSLFSREVVEIFAPGLETQALDLASKLTKIFSISIALLSVVGIQDGILNVYKKYTYAKISSEIAIFVRIIILLLLAGNIGVIAAVIGFMIGTFCSFIMSSLGTRKVAKYHFTISFKDPAIVLALKSSIPVFLGVGLAEINRVIDGAIASYMDSGSISSLQYASTLETAIVSLCITIINTIYYPILSRHVSKKENDELCKTYNLVMSLLIYISMPIFVGGTILKNEVVSIVYFRGAFTAENVRIVASLFSIYLVGIIFVGIRHTATNVLYAMTDTKTPMINSSIAVITNIILNILLGHFFGVFGLAIATVVAMIVATVFMIRSSYKKIDGLKLTNFYRSIGKSIVASAIMGSVVFIINKVLSINLYIRFIILLLIGVTIYLVMLIALKAPELNSFIIQIKEKRR